MLTVLPVELAEMVSASPFLVEYEYNLPPAMKSPALPLKLKVPVAFVGPNAVGDGVALVRLNAVGDGKATGGVYE
jgi:hypothetical protein